MLERSRFFRFLPRIAAWASLSAIALMAGAVEPAEAKAIKQSVIKIDAVPYTGTINSDVFRIYFNNTNFDPKTIDQASSLLEITRKGVKDTITVPIQDFAAPQPPKRGQNTTGKDGFVQWGASRFGAVPARGQDFADFDLQWQCHVPVKCQQFLGHRPEDQQPRQRRERRHPGLDGDLRSHRYDFR